MAPVERKNFSFYAPIDLTEKIKKIQLKDERLKALSRSQALYYIVSELADGKKSLEELITSASSEA